MSVRSNINSYKLFNFRQINYDPWEARHMASRLQSGGLGRMVNGSARNIRLPMVEMPPTGQNLQRIASTVIEAFNDHRVDLYLEGDLKRDLTKLRVEERSYGFRLTSPRDEFGHGDLGTAFCLALIAASELAAKPTIRAGTLRQNQPRTALERELDRLERKERYINDQRRIDQFNAVFTNDEYLAAKAILSEYPGYINRL